jgi:hypothetical protein
MFKNYVKKVMEMISLVSFDSVLYPILFTTELDRNRSPISTAVSP